MGLLLRSCEAGNSMAAKMAIIAMTTSNSIKVNPGGVDADLLTRPIVRRTSALARSRRVSPVAPANK